MRPGVVQVMKDGKQINLESVMDTAVPRARLATVQFLQIDTGRTLGVVWGPAGLVLLQ